MHPEALPEANRMLPDPGLVTCSADDSASANRDGVRSRASSRYSISAKREMDEEQASQFALHAACREGQSK